VQWWRIDVDRRRHGWHRCIIAPERTLVDGWLVDDSAAAGS
jgi:hypothetical protein